MGKKLIKRPHKSSHPNQSSSKQLEREALQALYPVDKEFYLSTSGLTEFPRNEYSYFLRYVFRFAGELRLRPDARSHGNFMIVFLNEL